jgi:CRISPR-associated endonuclease/helicase Cas3
MLRRVRAEPVVRRTAERLQYLAGDDQLPLLARSLRGGAPREDDWARTPVQPTILCSTVDQVGSRLLFRGYGVSDRMKPIHAGLLGSDCLILLDEAHLSRPFRQTLTSIRHLRRPDPAPFCIALLTATPDVKADRTFALSPDDRRHPILSRRITAAKPARLVEVGKHAVDTEGPRVDAIVSEVNAVLAELRATIVNPAIGVVVNRVARARSVFQRLKRDCGDVFDIILVIGVARPVDRDKIAAQLGPIRTGSPDAVRHLSKPFLVVATQTIEAGVDIDFDGLVTEAAALDALRQRFGRLNRAGRAIAASAVVLAYREDVGPKAADPVYGDRIAKTWNVLKRLADQSAGSIDFGIESFQARVTEGEAADLAAPTGDAPVLLPAYADLWSQTSPIPAADPEVALFLHGAERSPASVQVVWRADIADEDLAAAQTTEDVRARLVELLTLVPPRSAEAIEVPIWAARAFLRQQTGQLADLSDIAERAPTEVGGRGRLAFRYAGEDSDRSAPVSADQLKAGDLIVVPSSYGGCDKWGWNQAASEVVTDVADDAAWPYRARRLALRVTADLIVASMGAAGLGVGSGSRGELAAVGAKLASALAEHKEDDARSLLDVSWRIARGPLRDRLALLARLPSRRIRSSFIYGVDYQGNPRGVVLILPKGVGLPLPGGEAAAVEAEQPGEIALAEPATESDELGALSETPIGLFDHCDAVQKWAMAFVDRAGLPESLSADIRLAALLHDFGKADPRYQAYYAGGNPYGVDPTHVLAKSGQRRLCRGAWERAGLPPNWRHEALSVRLAMKLPNFEHAKDARLLLWLIGTHHGYGRPFFPHADTQDAETRLGLLSICGGTGNLESGFGPQSFGFSFEGLDWMQIFEALKASYGVWGLARLEAFVRLADHRASEEDGGLGIAGSQSEAAQ